MSSKKHLIIVPGHGIWKGTNDGTSSDDWYLESFQYEGDDHLAFIKQIAQGAKIYKESKEESILMFSGGQTKEIAGPISEALSYFEVLKNLAILEKDELDGVILEEYARDSFENVLFSLARYNQIIGEYPEFITIVGFEFKRHRFEKLHLEQALNWPLDRIDYIGFDPTPPYEVGSDQHVKYFQDLENSEYQLAVKLFEKDLLGKGEALCAKKSKRNPFNRKHDYLQSNPSFEGLFTED